MLLKLFYDSARKTSNDVNTFLNLRFIKKQKQAVYFFDKMLYANKLKVKKVSSNDLKVRKVSLNVPEHL